MNNIFRKSAIDRLSSPEQLDRMIPITTPSSWLILVGLMIGLVAFGIWAFIGEIQESTLRVGCIVESNQDHPNQNLVAICYWPLSERNTLKVGNAVTVSDSDHSERFSVISFDAYASDSHDMQTALHSSAMAEYLMLDEPAIAVYCSPADDAESDFLPGSLVQMSVITSTKHPINYVLPQSNK